MPISSGNTDRLAMMLVFSEVQGKKKYLSAEDKHIIIDTLIAKGWRIHQEPVPIVIVKRKSKIRKKVDYIWLKIQKLVVPHFL